MSYKPNNDLWSQSGTHLFELRKIRAYKRIATDLSDPIDILSKLIVDISISAEEPSISQWLAVYTILPKV